MPMSQPMSSQLQLEDTVNGREEFSCRVEILNSQAPGKGSRPDGCNGVWIPLRAAPALRPGLLHAIPMKLPRCQLGRQEFDAYQI